MTYLPAIVKGAPILLALDPEIYVAARCWAEGQERDDTDLAVHLVRRTALGKR